MATNMALASVHCLPPIPPPIPAFVAPSAVRGVPRGAGNGKRQQALGLRWMTVRQARGVATVSMMAETEPAGTNDASAQLLERARQAREEARELEIQYRKERGLADIDSEEAKASGVTSISGSAAPVSPASAGQASAAMAKSTPESRAELVTQLEDLPPNSKEVIAKMDQLKSDGLAPRWNSFNFGNRYPISQGQLKMQTGLDGKNLAADGGDMTDVKYALGIVCVASFVCAVAFGSVIGGNLGATFTYFFALLPIVFLAIGSTAPGVIIAVIDTFKRKSKEDFEERRVRHEAAHFLSGYLCGLPIKSYRADGGTTLVEFYDSVDGDLEGRALKFSPNEIDKVSIVAMSGSVGEAQAFGTATGGASDLDNLGQIMNQSKELMDANAQQAQARWATLMAFQLLSSHEPEMKALMQAFREAKPVAECVAALEGARSV